MKTQKDITSRAAQKTTGEFGEVPTRSALGRKLTSSSSRPAFRGPKKSAFKKSLAVLFFAVSFGTNLGALSFDLGLTGLPSPIYDNKADLGWDGLGLTTRLQTDLGPGRLGAGLEADFVVGSTRLYLPLGYTLPVVAQDDLEFALSLQALPGLALYRPYPLAILGAEALLEFAYYFDGLSGLRLSLGFRAAALPAWPGFSGGSQVWEIPVTLSFTTRSAKTGKN